VDLILTGDVARRVAAMTKNDKRLARMMARELLASLDRTVVAAYLLTDDVALDLLALRLAADLETTLADLEQLAAGGSPSRRPARARRARPVAAKTQAQAQAKPRKRVHLTTAQVAEIKTRVQVVLKAGPASRKQICRVVKFPSISTYNRIMGELRGDHVIVVEGERGKAVYTLGKALAAKKAKKTKKTK
jgi:hypothetical protein